MQCHTPEDRIPRHKFCRLIVDVTSQTASEPHFASSVRNNTTLLPNYAFTREKCSYKYTTNISQTYHKHRLYKIPLYWPYQSADRIQLAFIHKNVFKAMNIKHEPYRFCAIILQFLPSATISVLCISVSHAENKLKTAKYIKGTFRMESGGLSETLVPIYQTARRHITEYRNRNELHNCKTPN